MFEKVAIYGNSLKDKLYPNGVTSCTPKDLFCQLGDLVIAWYENIIHQCPFSFIQKLKLNVSDAIYLSENQNLLFQKLRETETCGLKMIETTEGLYITADKLPRNLQNSSRELKAVHQLIISDLDYKSLTGNERTTQLVNKLNEHLCNSFRMILKLYEKQTNKYFVINDLLGNEITLFNNDGLVMIADCVQINNISIVENMLKCFEYPEVYFTVDNNKEYATLFNDNIIAKNKEVILDCKRRRITLTGGNTKIIITKNGSNIILPVNNPGRDVTNVEWEKTEENFNTPDALKQEVD